jgi:glycogen synthase
MRVNHFVQVTLAVALLSVSVGSYAYSVGEVEEACKKPQVREFSLPTYQEPEKIEVAAESEFSFKLSEWTDPSTIKVTMKEQSVPIVIESNSSFHKVTAKIPAEYTGKYVRINLFSKAIIGCYEREGWLVKVANK